jgi:precorrin-2 dehydrogenase/sirohydrochlorin ferrochelatase
MLDLSNRLIVIIGAGAVAARKVTGLNGTGAIIRVISPEFRADFPGGIERVVRPYQPGDLKGAALVFAATDSATINDAVVRDAAALGVLANRADSSESEPGDFTVPAKFVSGPVTVTVSAGSAALTAAIVSQLQARFDPAWSAMAEAMQELRPWIKSIENDGARRRELFLALVSPAAFDVLRDKGVDGLKKWILRQ